jgi:predicted phosphodiesterase
VSAAARRLALVATLAGASAVLGSADAGARTTVRAAADTFVWSQVPGQSYGRLAKLRVDSRPKATAYIRFDLGTRAIPGRAVLRLYPLSNTRKGVLVRLAKSEWDERTLSFAAAPQATSEVVRSGRIRKRRWTSIDITSLLGSASSSTVNLAITGNHPHAVVFASRESRRHAPRLVLGGAARRQPARSGLRVAAVGDIHPPSASSNSAETAREAAKADIILGLGDYQYPSGSLADFNRYFDKDWGPNVAKMYPVFGPTHDQNWEAGDPLDYFLGRGLLGARVPVALSPLTAYSFDKAGWHFVALPDSCYRVSGCDGAATTAWLERDLDASRAKCTIAYWHQAYFTSDAEHPPFGAVRPWVDVLAAHHVDIVLQGHNHDYERFAPQDPARKADPNGMQAFVVGTGGIGFYKFRNTAPNSVERNDSTYGVLQLALSRTSYSWQFVPVAGGSYTDSGSMDCR